ncbi:MAG: serine/threonine protein kinase [Deltaproteobacteria bacterium]|nr:serine/threonine protein kinase [Deltaproteobacteria bacterium]MDQ3299279.1 serine/threonine protein kinase [Myxococcota bacterium]
MSVDGPPASGSLPIAAPPSLVGQVLDGRYKIIRKLGEGGMGEVYAAEHVHIEKRFAIKLLRPEIVSNAEAVQRFRQEARSSSSIGHRNIIAIEDFGQMADGRIYMCMELLNGAALNDLIQQPQPVDRLLNIMIQTGHGLAAAHAKGIVHRDMKPENVFVTLDANNQDVPKLLDFGIAKVSGNDGQNNLTRTGTIFGTPFYMAPEQALGNPVDARTDIYAMGVIMYELFAGSLPFQGESFMGILTQHITTDPEPVSQRAAKAGRSLPPGLADVITRCMQKNPAQRFSTMDELVGTLVQIYRGVAGAGMSTYMEAFPVSARMAATPGPMTGMQQAHPMSSTATPDFGQPHGPPPGHHGPPPGQHGQHGQSPPFGQPSVPYPQPHQPSGGHAVPASSSGSGLYDTNASVVNVPKKNKTGMIVAIVAVLAVGGAIAAFVAMSNKKKQAAGDGSGSQIASTDGDGSAGSSGAGGGPDVGKPDTWGGGSAVADAGSDNPAIDAGEAGSAGSAGSAGTDPIDVGSAGSATVPPPAVDAGVEAPAAVSVLLMTKNGVAFEAFEDGKRLFEGPDNLSIVPGTPRTLVIKAKGFKDKTLVVDGKTKKVSIKLDRAAGQTTTVPKINCSSRIVDPTSKTCVAQFCASNPDDLKCSL